MRKFGAELKKLGVVVYEPYLHQAKEGEWEVLSSEYQKLICLGLTHDHFCKIRMADVVFVFNKDGYAGNSTTLEIGYAIALGKPIYSLEPDAAEDCRDCLYCTNVKTAKELAALLQ
jgi:nucleoside 2-deoxyribosyltransferase